MKRRPVAALMAPLAAAALALIPAASPTAHAGVAGHRAEPAACRHTFDPYKVSLARVRSCGGLIYPLARVRPLPGGGRIYYYDMNGVMATMRVPPRRFRPLTATAAQLLRYGFPPRPRGGGRPLAQWISMMRRIGAVRPPAPPAYLVGDPRAGLGEPRDQARSGVRPADDTRLYWAGNAATASFEYDEVNATYNEPETYPSQCADTAMSQWVGIGGFNPADYTYVAQAGTSLDWPASARVNTDQAFYQIVNHTYPVAEPFYATTNEQFFVEVDISGGEFYFFFYNGANGQSMNGQYPEPTGFEGNSAEMMIERVSQPKLMDLTNFESLPVTDAYAASPDIQDNAPIGIGELAHTDFEIVSQTTAGYVMAYPGATSAAGADWTFYQRRCY